MPRSQTRRLRPRATHSHPRGTPNKPSELTFPGRSRADTCHTPKAKKRPQLWRTCREGTGGTRQAPVRRRMFPGCIERKSRPMSPEPRGTTFPASNSGRSLAQCPVGTCRRDNLSTAGHLSVARRCPGRRACTDSARAPLRWRSARRRKAHTRLRLSPVRSCPRDMAGRSRVPRR